VRSTALVAAVLAVSAACAGSSNRELSAARAPQVERASATRGPWVLWFHDRGRERTVDPETGAVVELASRPIPPTPQLEVTIGGEAFRSNGQPPLPSPDGRRLAWELLGDQYLRVVWTERDGSAPVVVNPAGGDTRFPLWSPDGSRLLFATQDDPARDDERILVHDLGTRRETSHDDQAMRLMPRPVLVDGGRWLHVRARRDDGRLVHDLAEVDFAPGARAEVLVAYVVTARDLLVSTDGAIVWLCGFDSLWRYDRRARQLTHSWLPGALLDSREPHRPGTFHLRPDGDAIAVEMHHFPDEFGWRSRDPLGTVLITVDRASSAVTVRRLGPDVAKGLRGFVAAAGVSGR
jgi:hypothetical protein